MAPLRIYLSGSVRKGDTDLRSSIHFWSEIDERRIIEGLSPMSVELLNPTKTLIDRSDVLANFGCDLYLVGTSDVVLVDARVKKGIGIGAEMMFASVHNIPVITWAPEQSHYRRPLITDLYGKDVVNWTHPFIFGLSDFVVDSLDEAIILLRRRATEGRLAGKKDVDGAISYFLSGPDAAGLRAKANDRR